MKQRDKEITGDGGGTLRAHVEEWPAEEDRPATVHLFATRSGVSEQEFTRGEAHRLLDAWRELLGKGGEASKP